MKWFKNMKIARQLVAIVVALVIGFGAIGFSYYRVLVIEGESAENLNNLVEFQGLVESARADLLIGQRYAREFQINNQLESLEGFDTTINRALETISRIAASSPSAENELVVNEIGTSVTTFQTSVYAASEPQLAIGLDASSGLIGDLRDISSTVLRTLSGIQNTALTASFLTLTNHEKDYVSLADDDFYAAEKAEFDKLLRQVKRAAIAATTSKLLTAQLQNYQRTFEELVANIELQKQSRKDAQTIANDIDPLFNTLLGTTVDAVDSSRANSQAQSAQITLVFVATMAVIFVVMSGLLVLLARKLSQSLSSLQSTVMEVGSGDLDSRTGMDTDDELGSLGKAFDKMLDDRMSQLRVSATENDVLNNSVVELMDAVSQLGQRDLTVKIPVNEDVTGPVADAINLMAEETAKVLGEIKHSAQKVGSAAGAVKSQGDKVSAEALREQEIVKTTVATLNESAVAMKDISTLAQGCSELARDASDATTAAVDAVESTSSGMNDIRETISETEKRIKRLGERSQEINAVVDIINGIAERTHVLALNASMQAAAAGEAGRGFAVVADEVQRLAESSRESTSQIGALVNNIQVETSETMATMNKTIGQVVEGTEIANLARQKMEETNTKSAALSNSVQKIAESSIQQSGATADLVAKASEIEASTQNTRKALQLQASFTDQLISFSKKMLDSVRVFTLPEYQGSAANDDMPVLSNNVTNDPKQENGSALSA